MDYVGLKSRIAWVDVFKGIAIMCVVYGHIGFVYNYVYQFHMAAFFFISGYLTLLTKENWVPFVMKKAYALLIPYTFVFLLLLLFLKATCWLWPAFDGALGAVPDCSVAIVNFFGQGLCPINVLGATWFILALFLVEVIDKTIWSLAIGKSAVSFSGLGIFFLASSVIFGIGVYLFNMKLLPRYGLDIAFVGQIFFAVGVLTRQFDVLERIRRRPVVLMILLVLSTVILLRFGQNPPIIAFPTRTISGTLWSVVGASFNGIVLCFSLSSLITSFFPLPARSILETAGSNSMGIIFFHFLGFKVGFALLALFSVLPWEYLRNLVPEGYYVILKWHWLFFATGVIIPILAWVFLKGVPVVRTLIGCDKSCAMHIMEKFYHMTGRVMTVVRQHVDLVYLSRPSVVFAVGMILYVLFQSRTLSADHGFLFDDYSFWFRSYFNTSPLDTFSWLPIQSHDDRPVRDMLMFAIFRIGSYRAWVANAVVFSLHLLNTGLLFACIRLFALKIGKYDFIPMFCATLMWALWPTSTLGAYWLSGNCDVLGTSLALMMYLFYEYRSDNRALTFLSTATVIFLHLIALRTKEMFVLTPFVFGLLEILRHSMEDVRPWGGVPAAGRFLKGVGFRKWWLLTITGTISIAYAYRIMSLGTTGEYTASFSPAVLARNFIKYLVLYFDVFTPTMQYFETAHEYLVWLVCVFGALVLIRKLIVEKTAGPMLLLAGFALSLATVLTLTVMTHVLYLYAPSIFMAALIAGAICSLARKHSKALQWICCFALLVVVNVSPGVRGLHNYWDNLVQSDGRVIKALMDYGPIDDGQTLHVMGTPAGYYNAFTYEGFQPNECAMLCCVLKKRTVARDFDPDVILCDKPGIMCWNYPDLKFGSMEEYLRDTNRRVTLDAVVPSSVVCGVPFNVQPGGASAVGITGSGMSDDMELYFNDIPAQGVCYVNDRYCTALFPPQLLGRRGRITVSLRRTAKHPDYILDENAGVWRRSRDKILAVTYMEVK